MSTNKDKNKPSTINVFEEQAQVGKKVEQTGKVRIEKKVDTIEEDLNIALKNEDVKVERVAVNRYVDEPPPVRYEGNTTIISVIKEVAVIEKRILVVEEVHISKNINITREEKTVPLRKEQVIVKTVRSE
jgi:stress response protein YsnF